MKEIVVIIGSLCREHIICEKLKLHNPVVISDFLNNKIYDICEEYIIDTPLSNDNIIKNILELQKEYEIEYVIFNQEKFIAQGLVDELEKKNIFCIAPLKNFGRIEWDKYFARKLLNDNSLSHFNPDFKYFDYFNKNEIINFINKLNNNYVVKDTSLKGGKGVKVSSVHLKNIDETLEFCNTIIKQKGSFLIEEKLIGSEFSLHTITDGAHLSHMFPVSDYKRLDNYNKGPNTGSLGCISGNLNFLNEKDLRMSQEINKQILILLKKLNNNGKSYKGFLYGSFIKTIDNKIKIIEFNSRLGDPEAIPLLTLLKTDLHLVFKSLIDGNFKNINMEYKSEFSLTRYIVPSSYCREEIEFKNHEILIPNIENIFYGDIIYKDGRSFTNKSRSIAIISTGKNLNKLYQDNQNIINKIICSSFHYRTDIGQNLSYKSSGVNIDNYEKCLNNVMLDIKSTHNSYVLKKNYPNFAGIYDFKNGDCLITSNDGVGSKSQLSFKYKNQERLRNLGKDVVVNNLNDALCISKNLKPLTFIDYLSMNKINKDFEEVIKGIVDECKKYDLALIGGETSEMNIYKHDNNIEIVGFINCLSRKEDLFNISDVKKNNIILGIKTKNFATNGFSLVRKVLEYCDEDEIKLYIDDILDTHKSYYDYMKKLHKNSININACAHITGGGIFDNLQRIIPNDLNFKIIKSTIFDNLPACMNFIKIKGNLNEDELLKTFNCGIGFCLIVDIKNVSDIFELFGKDIIEIGYIY